MRLGIFGGTFNPIHYGHLRAAEESRFMNHLDKILFVPSGNPPVKSSELVDASLRFLMTQLATSSNPYFVVSDIEMGHSDKSYTVRSIERFKELYAGDELFLILGTDAFLDMPAWRQPEKIIEMIDIIIVTRGGYNLKEIINSPYIKKDKDNLFFLDELNSLNGSNYKPELELINGRRLKVSHITSIAISSTQIRDLIKNGKSIKYLVPEKIEKFIYDNDLYRTRKS